MRIRKFLETDREHCLAVFDSAVPEEYAPDERPEFRAFLDDPPDSFWVVEEQWRILGCGGVRIDPDGETARLCWGMVDRGHQREGWGSFLMGAILAWIRRQPDLRRVTVRATPDTRGFFERFGFEPVGPSPARTAGEGPEAIVPEPIQMALELEDPHAPRPS